MATANPRDFPQPPFDTPQQEPPGKASYVSGATVAVTGGEPIL